MSRLKDLREAFRTGALAKDAYIRAMHEVHATLFEYADLLPETELSAIEIEDGSVVVTVRETGGRFGCDPHDWRIAPLEVLNFARYEPEVADMMRALIEPGAHYVDVGANIGWYAVNLALAIPDLRVTAFEPVPATFAQLARNVALNGLGARIEALPFGLSDRAGTAVMHFYPEGSGNASLEDLSHRESVERIACRFDVLDDWAARTGAAPQFVKCDVEGAELLVFRGATKTLAAHRPIVLAELLRKWSAAFHYHPNDALALFAGLGYGCFVARADGRLAEVETVTDATVETNFFFLHRERHADAIRRHGALP